VAEADRHKPLDSDVIQIVAVTNPMSLGYRRMAMIGVRTEGPSDVIAKTLEAFGGIDILVWNSGGPPAGKAGDVTDDTLETAFELLLVPAVRLVRLCRPHLEQSEAGRIVAITSLTAKEPTAHLALSNAIRPGLIGWLKTLSREVGPSGVTVNCVAPGRIDTPRMTEVYGENGPPAEEMAQIPVGRLGTPREFGDVVCFLASARAAYISGTTILVDGGMSRGLL